MTPTGEERPRLRQARVGRNTDRILDATVAVLANEGWGGVTFSAVGREAGVAASTVRERFGRISTLVGRAWIERLAPGTRALTERCIGGLRTARETDDTRPLVNAWRELCQRSPEQDAALEVMVVAHYEPEVATFVDATLRDVISLHVSPHGRISPVDATHFAYTLSVAFGLLLTNRYPWARDEGLATALALRADVLCAPAPERALPTVDAPHLDAEPQLAPGDPALDRLLNAALGLIATHGYDAFTVKQAAAVAGYTEGLAFRRYPTKADMVDDASRRQRAAGLRLNEAFMRDVESTHGLAIAEAVYLRESLRPDRVIGRVMALEETRLAWHSSAMHVRDMSNLTAFRADLLQLPGWGQIETEADFYLDFAAPYGALLLPRFVADVGQLPWNVVTEPLVAAMTAAAERRTADPSGCRA